MDQQVANQTEIEENLIISRLDGHIFAERHIANLHKSRKMRKIHCNIKYCEEDENDKEKEAN